MQSRRQSALESLIRAGFNYCTALGLQIVVLPLFFHARIPLRQNLLIGLAFMANSIIGGYAIRRVFNALHD